MPVSEDSPEEMFETVGQGYYDGDADSLQFRVPTMSAIMSVDVYQSMTRETAIYPGAMSAERHYSKHGRDENGVSVPLEAIAYVGLGLSEVGEIQGKIKKLVRDGGLFDGRVVITDEKRVELLKEIGDAHWYLARLVDELQASTSEVLAGNINKLRSRKARGKIQGSGDNR